MIQVITENDFYTISVNKEIQRLYIKINGLWNSAKLVPNYYKDVINAAEQFDWKFTCLADFSEMRPYSEEVEEEVHIPVMKALFDAGIDRGAQIMPKHHHTIDTLEKLGGKLGVQFNMFDSSEFAEMYLNYVRV